MNPHHLPIQAPPKLQKTICRVKLYRLSLFLILALLGWNAQSQTRKAIILKNRFGHKAGDTIELKGHFPSFESFPEKYYVWDGYNYRRAKPSLFHVIDSSSNFWDNIWYLYRSGEITRKGWGESLRRQLQEDRRVITEQFDRDHLLFEDDLLKDYLYQLVRTICPMPLHKGFQTDFKIYVLKSTEPKSFSFDDGTIVISTAKLIQLSNEKELVKTLADEVGNIVLDHQYKNLRRNVNARNGAAVFTALVGVTTTALAIENEAKGKNTFTMDDARALTAATAIITDISLENMGVNPTWEQLSQTAVISRKYMRENDSLWKDENTLSFMKRIAGVYTYSAYQEYYKSNFNGALSLVNKLDNSNLASQDDYLLKAKLYRILYATDESNYEALKYLKLAKDAAPTKNVDIFKEEGLIYMRMNEDEKAVASLQEYKTGLQELGDADENELRWVNSTLERIGKTGN